MITFLHQQVHELSAVHGKVQPSGLDEGNGAASFLIWRNRMISCSDLKLSNILWCSSVALGTFQTFPGQILLLATAVPTAAGPTAVSTTLSRLTCTASLTDYIKYWPRVMSHSFLEALVTAKSCSGIYLPKDLVGWITYCDLMWFMFLTEREMKWFPVQSGGTRWASVYYTSSCLFLQIYVYVYKYTV